MRGRTLLFAASLLAAAPRAAAAAVPCPVPSETFMQAVALYDGDAVLRLEPAPCPGKDPHACRQDAVERRIVLHDRPGGETVGDITVVYAQDAPITARLALAEAGAPVPYLPAIYDPDWGYGPWFHATLLDRRGEWLRIPVPTLPSAWIRLPDARIIDLAGGDINFLGFGDATIALRDTPGGLAIRDAQGQEACCGGAPPENPAWRALDRESVYGADCELRLVPACPRGC